MADVTEAWPRKLVWALVGSVLMLVTLIVAGLATEVMVMRMEAPKDDLRSWRSAGPIMAAQGVYTRIYEYGIRNTGRKPLTDATIILSVDEGEIVAASHQATLGVKTRERRTPTSYEVIAPTLLQTDRVTAWAQTKGGYSLVLESIGRSNEVAAKKGTPRTRSLPWVWWLAGIAGLMSLVAAAVAAGRRARSKAAAQTLRQSTERKESADRPDITGWVTSISFGIEPGENTFPGLGAIDFAVLVRNRGNQETTLVSCFLVVQGESRADAHSLLMSPSRPRIAARHEQQLRVVLRDPDIEDYRNLNATLYLRDASDREYPIEVRGISPSLRMQSISDLPVRED